MNTALHTNNSYGRTYTYPGNMFFCHIVRRIRGHCRGAKRLPNIPPEWQTKAEQTNYQKTSTYDETIAFCQKLDKASDLIYYTTYGKSGEGRDLPMLIASTDRTFTPDAARRKTKAVIFIQAGIHAGEIDGKDAGLALLRDIAITKTRTDLLKDVVILFAPIYNVDGHENSQPVHADQPERAGRNGLSRQCRRTSI